MAIIHYVKAARPKTLTASWIPVLVGTVLAFKQSGLFNLVVFICALLSSLFIQVATNYINDAIDFKKGADSTGRIGPERMTHGGFVDYKEMMGLGLLSLLVAGIFGVPVIVAGGYPIILIGITSLVLAYAYTGGPFPLAYLGLGDIFVYFFFGLVAVGGSDYVQVLKISPQIFVAGSQIGLLAVALIAINNFRDAREDVKVGKKTLAVRFGSKFSRIEITVASFLPYVIGILYCKYFWATYLPIIGIILPIFITYKVWKTEVSTDYNKYLSLAGLHHMIFGILLVIGIVIS